MFLIFSNNLCVFKGSFTVAFDFDDCGSEGINFCQTAISTYNTTYSKVYCTPDLVSDLATGGDHCVSSPIDAQSFVTSIEGDNGTLQHALNTLKDDNLVEFMSISGMPFKETGISVHRTGRIKSKGGCSENFEGNAAQCYGSYELFYTIEFDAPHTSGDVPELTIMHSNLKVNQSSVAYLEVVCPESDFPHGCEKPLGKALNNSFGNYYEGAFLDSAVESVKGSQPSGTISLHYECESSVIVMENGSMTTLNRTGSFSDTTFVSQMVPGQFVRFNNTPGNDHYRKIISVDKVAGVILFDEVAPINSSFTDVEYGYYFSDWSESDGFSGISDICRSSRIYSTLPIDISIEDDVSSVSDWESKIKGLSVIDSTGVEVTRVLSDLSLEVGYIWKVTFDKQPGNINQMSCSTLSGINSCEVLTSIQASILSGGFHLKTSWPHEYEVPEPSQYVTSDLMWNIDPSTLRDKLEAVKENNEMVFGKVNVSRSPYIPSTHSRWSGGYTWTITFTTRGGNIPVMDIDISSLLGLQPVGEVADEDSGLYDSYIGLPNSKVFTLDDPGTARDGNQISGSFALSWEGNDVYPSISTLSVFSVQTGGDGMDKFTALSAQRMYALFTEHIFHNNENMITVSRSNVPSQVMGYTYIVTFIHEDVGGDVTPFTLMNSTLGASESAVLITEQSKGNSILGTFQLRFDGETTRPIPHDASAKDVESALNELISISPSAITVSRSNIMKTGPADGASGLSTQVGGYVWSVTFLSNIWKDPTAPHNSSFIPGNWVGDAVDRSDVWESGFSKAWGKNVGNVGMIECLRTGLYTTTGVFPTNGCAVEEVIQGTDPLGGSFRVCLDTTSNTEGSISVSQSTCSDFINHDALASAAESYGDGSSMEEKLEAMANIGDVNVQRGQVNTRNGGYTWTVTFLSDVDGPCEQKDDIVGSCNSPGNVPKLCHPDGLSICDSSALTGSCSRPELCSKLTTLDELDYLGGIHPPASNEIQQLVVQDQEYLGWEDGSIVSTSNISEYKLNVTGTVTSCIKHDASAFDLKSAIQDALDIGVGGTVNVVRRRSEDIAPNGFVYFLTFFGTGNISTSMPIFSSDVSVCNHGFLSGQEVSVLPSVDGSFHPTTCSTCKDGVIQRGDFTVFEVEGDNLSGALPWNANEEMLKTQLESHGRFVEVERKVLDKYGSIEWRVTFVSNPGFIPPGSGDIEMLQVVQESDSAGIIHPVLVQELQKGSLGLSGTFTLDYEAVSGPLELSFDESSRGMMFKLNELETIGDVFVERYPFPSNSTGGWGDEAVSNNDEIGGFQWNIFFVKNLGSAEGYSFPPGSGNVATPTITYAELEGNEASVHVSTLNEGSEPLSGKFELVWMNEESSQISYYASSKDMEQAINDIDSLGSMKVHSSLCFNQRIPGITAVALKDHSSIYLNGDDVRKYLAPGDQFRLGGKLLPTQPGVESYPDGGEALGSVDIFRGSPILRSNDMNGTDINVLEEVRLSGDTYTIARNGEEIQQLVVHRDNSIVDAPFYKLIFTVDGLSQSTSCLRFDASSDDVASSLNHLPSIGENGVYVTRSNDSNGFIGNAHFYRIYFRGTSVTGNIDELDIEYCLDEMPSGLNSANSHIAIKTIVEGGSIEHQQIILTSDTGSITPVGVFSVKFTDQNANIFETGCLEWGEPNLGIEQIVLSSFSGPTLEVGTIGILQIETNIYDLHVSRFVEGIIDIDDQVRSGENCTGRVISVGKDGQTIRIECKHECNINSGDEFIVIPDIRIVESFSGSQAFSSSISKLTMFSDMPVIDRISKFFRLQVIFKGESRSTSCLPYGIDANSLKNEIGLLFDYDQSGSIDSMDAEHISVRKDGDGSSAWAFGFVYQIESSGKILILSLIYMMQTF